MREQIELQRKAFVAGARAFMEVTAQIPGPGFNDYWEPRAAARYPLTIAEPRVLPSRRPKFNTEFRVVDDVVQQRYPTGELGTWLPTIAVHLEDIPVIQELRTNPTVTRTID